MNKNFTKVKTILSKATKSLQGLEFPRSPWGPWNFSIIKIEAITLTELLPLFVAFYFGQILLSYVKIRYSVAKLEIS